MAKVKKVVLDIQPAFGTTPQFKVTVKATLGFDTDEEGKRFNFRINLYDDSAGVITSGADPIYKFKFDGSIAKNLKVQFPMQLVYTEPALVPSSVLNVNPGGPDAIRAGVLLRSGGAGQPGVLVSFKTSNRKVIGASVIG